MVGFLKFVGYSLEEICSIINEEACWGDYDAARTYNQVRSVFRLSGRVGSGRKAISSPYGTWIKREESVSSPSGTWIKREEWDKRYNKALCSLHFVSCKECPDRSGSGCKWVKK